MKLKKHISIILYFIMFISYIISVIKAEVLVSVIFYLSFIILYKYSNLKQVIIDFINY